MPRRRHRKSDPHYPAPVLKVVEEGELLVTGRGEAIVDVPLRRTRALLVKSEEAVQVYFKPDEDCPPCAGEAPDDLDWDVVERERQLFLRFCWRVNCARTIIWKIFEVD